MSPASPVAVQFASMGSLPFEPATVASLALIGTAYSIGLYDVGRMNEDRNRQA